MAEVVYGCTEARQDVDRYFAGTGELTQTQKDAFVRVRRHAVDGTVVCSSCWDYYQDQSAAYARRAVGRV